MFENISLNNSLKVTANYLVKSKEKENKSNRDADE